MARPRNDEPTAGPTGKVRVGREVAARLARFCPPGQTAKTLGPAMEPWISEQYAQAVEELRHLEPSRGRAERGRHREVVTLRLPWWHVRRLGIIAEAKDQWVGELVERWLLEWLTRQELAAQASGPDADREVPADAVGVFPGRPSEMWHDAGAPSCGGEMQG
jgi:hypothetical protein